MSIDDYTIITDLAPKLDKSEQRSELTKLMSDWEKDNKVQDGAPLCKTVAEVLESKRCTTNLNQTISHDKPKSWGSFKS